MDFIPRSPTDDSEWSRSALSGARLKAGFSHVPWDLALDVKETVEGHNSWYNNRKLLHRLQVPVTKDDYVGLIKVEPREGDSPPPKGRYAIIAPGASR